MKKYRICGVLAALATIALPVTAQNKRIAGSPGFGSDPSGLAYTVEEMLVHVEAVYGPELADEIRNATGQGGSIEVAELYNPLTIYGVSDNDTIFIDTKTQPDGDIRIDVFAAAMVLVHEYEHAKRAQNAGTTGDPAIVGDCGPCNHAKMFFDQMLQIAASKCPVEPDEYSAVCGHMRRARNGGNAALKDCPAEDCPEEYSAASAAKGQAEQKYVRCCSL